MANIKARLGRIVGVLSQVAPTIAAGLGGPLAGTAVQQIVTVLGLPQGSPDDHVEQAILQSNDPQVLLKLKQAEQDYATAMKQAGVDLAKLQEEDVASARQRETLVRDKTPARLGYGIVLFFAAYAVAALALATRHALDAAAMGFAGTVLGYAISEVRQVFTYYFGSSAGQDEAAKTIAGKLNGEK